MKGHCTNCNQNFELGERVGWKIGVAAAGLALGGGVAKHPLGAILGGLAGFAIGHVVDTQVLPNCPTCQRALELVASVA